MKGMHMCNWNRASAVRRIRMQVMEVIGAYRDAPLPPTVFAGAVPNNWECPLDDLLRELYNDDAVTQQRLRVCCNPSPCLRHARGAYTRHPCLPRTRIS
jgi:hypothetical protein